MHVSRFKNSRNQDLYYNTLNKKEKKSKPVWSLENSLSIFGIVKKCGFMIKSFTLHNTVISYLKPGFMKVDRKDQHVG